ncbi:MAG: dienelactone hydrolase [Firmicutes bacterium]|nr:dienelactone hydrolase [Bacillota bacterium]
MAYEIEGFLDCVCESARPRFPASSVLSGETDHKTWRDSLRNALTRVIGGFPADPPALGVKIVRTSKPGGVTRHFIEYQSQNCLTTPGYYLVPDEPLPGNPAVVAVTGHGYGVDDIVGIRPDGADYGEGDELSYQKRFGLALCRRGFHVLAPEMAGFGHMRLAGDKAAHPDQTSCHQLSTRLLMAGSTTAAVRVYQCMRAIDALTELRGADKNRVGCMGISGGGLVTAFLAALDDRVKACVVSGYASRFRTSVLAVKGHCVDNFFFGALNVCELPDILSAVAPRPMLWEAAEGDDIFPIASVMDAAGEVEKMYGFLKAPEMFEVDVFTGGHQISGRRSYDFLAEHL